MSQILQGKAGEVADMLFDRGAVMFAGVGDAPADGFRLKLHENDPDAPLSPIYLSIRSREGQGGPLECEDFGLIAELLVEIIDANDYEFDILAGIPQAGDPIAEALDRLLRKKNPDLQLWRLSKVQIGDQRRIAPPSHAVLFDRRKNRAVLVDDLVTKADTKLEAIRVAEECQLKVAGILVIVNRQQGGVEEIENAGYNIVEAFRLDELLDHYVETGRIDRSLADKVMAYVTSS